MNPEKRRPWKRGGGAVKLHHGAWYVRFSYGGKRHEERTDAKTEREARSILRARLTDAERGDYLPDAAKTRMGELFEDMARDYAINGKLVVPLRNRWAHLSPVFGSDLAATVTTGRIRQYVETRFGEGAKPASVQVELATLRRMLRLGTQGGKVVRVPHFPTISVNNTRKGFFERDTFERVLAELPAYLRPIAITGYWLGWRKAELLGLQWRQVNLTEGTVRLDPGTTKNKEGRLAHLPPEALEALTKWRNDTSTIEREQGVIIPNVFNKDGKPIRSFDYAWRAACRRAGVPGMLFHDLRRTAARNYVRSGTSERVAMKILGHKTRSMFDRYQIVAEDDLREAAARVAAARRVARIGTVVGPIGLGGRKKVSKSKAS
jgi:integrase